MKKIQKNIKIILGDICYPKSETLILPANSKGIMNKGVLKRIRKDGWKIIENEAKEECNKKTLVIGDIFVTGPGKLKRRGVKIIYHCVLQKFPGEYISLGSIKLVLAKALKMAKDEKSESVTVCNIGSEGNGLCKYSEARIILEECYKIGLNIKIMDSDEEFIDNVRKIFQKKRGPDEKNK